MTPIHKIDFFRHRTSPTLLVLFIALLSFSANFLQFSGPNQTTMDAEWMVVLFIFVVFQPKPAFVGVILGHGLFTILFPSRFADIGVHRIIILKEYIYFFCLLISMRITVIARRHRLRATGFYVSFGILVAIIISITLFNLDNRLIMVYGIATIIIAILTMIKSGFLKSWLQIPFLAWFSGFAVFVVLIRVLRLDPDSFRMSTAFLTKFIVIPVPIYLLELLIIGTIGKGIGRSNN